MPRSTHFTSGLAFCATHGIVEKAGDFASGAIGGPSTAASSFALKKIRGWNMDRGEFQAALAALGPAVLNAKIVARAMQREPFPDDVPGHGELDRFTSAMAEVRAFAGEVAAS